jgi:hypothetical protein
MSDIKPCANATCYYPRQPGYILCRFCMAKKVSGK